MSSVHVLTYLWQILMPKSHHLPSLQEALMIYLKIGGFKILLTNRSIIDTLTSTSDYHQLINLPTNMTNTVPPALILFSL